MNIMKIKLIKRIVSITLCMAMVAAISLPLSMGAVSAVSADVETDGIQEEIPCYYIDKDGNQIPSDISAKLFLEMSKNGSVTIASKDNISPFVPMPPDTLSRIGSVVRREVNYDTLIDVSSIIASLVFGSVWSGGARLINRAGVAIG